MSDEHAAAVLALLQADPFLTVHDGQVPNDPALPYVVLWYGDRAVPHTLSGISTQRDAAFQLTSVGGTPASARIVRARARAAVVDQRPAVAGRSTRLIRHQLGRPVTPDFSVDPPVYMAVDLYTWQTVAA